MPALPIRRILLEEWLKTGGGAGFDRLVLRDGDPGGPVDLDSDSEDEDSASSASEDSDDDDLGQESGAPVLSTSASSTTNISATPTVADVSTSSSSITSVPASTLVGATGSPSASSITILPNPSPTSVEATDEDLSILSSSSSSTRSTSTSPSASPQPLGGNSSSPKSNTGAIAAAVVTSLIGAVLLGLLIYVLIMRRRRRVARKNLVETFQPYVFNMSQPGYGAPPTHPPFSPTISAESRSTRGGESVMRQSAAVSDRGFKNSDFIQGIPAAVIHNTPPTVGGSGIDDASGGMRPLTLNSFASTNSSTRGGRMVEFPSRF